MTKAAVALVILRAQHDRRLARFVHCRPMTDEVGAFERHVEKEPQRGDGGVDGPCADLLLRHMQLKTAKVLAHRRVRRPAEEGREGSDVPDVVLLHLLLETARGHVGVSFGRPKTYVAGRRQTRKLPGESRMLSGGAGEIHQVFSDRIVNGRPPPERSIALFWLGSKLDNVALWESGTGPTLKNRGPSAFSTSSISRQLFERHDGISVPMAAQPVRLPQRPALVLFWATKSAESLISSSLARFGLRRGSHWRRSSEVAHRSKPERFSHPLSGSASAWFSRSCC